ncbi:MAG: Fe-S cluster assembly protein SufD, partial [Candidatus Hydrogenedens sp.]
EHFLHKGLEAFEVLTIPHAKTEGWRETNLTPFFNPQRLWMLKVQKNTHDENIPPNIYNAFPPSVLWENGAIHIKPNIPSQIIVKSFRDTLHTEYGEIIQKNLIYGQEPQHVFEAMSDMLMHNGIFLYIPEAVQVEEPIHIVIVSRVWDSDTLDVPRVLIYLEDNTQATITMHYIAETKEPHSLWINTREQIFLGKNAHLKYLNSVHGTENTLRFLLTSAVIEDDSSFSYNSLHLSGQFIRSEIDVEIQGENVNTQINGLTINHGQSFSETQQLIQHLKGHTTSRINWRGLGQGQSKTVYRGKIYIAPDAQKSDSIQQFKGLSLSDQAIIDAKPQLEIYADDVLCTHGATVGPPPPDLIYYFQTRGIHPNKARNLLIHGFVNQVLKEFPFKGLEYFIHGYMDVSEKKK